MRKAGADYVIEKTKKETLAMDLEEWRIKERMTVTEVAIRLGKPVPSVWFWCKRKVTPNMEIIKLIKEKCSKHIDEFLKDPDKYSN